MVDVEVGLGFAETERGEIAGLYWHAFGRKLIPAFHSQARGIAAVTAALRSDRILVARMGNKDSGCVVSAGQG